MSERLNKTSICSIVFLDIVEYSEKSVSEQFEIKDRFNSIISEAIKDVAQNDRIILDTGDGAAITLLGEPESALFVSMTIRDGILKDNQAHPDFPLLVRIGINLGPVRVVSDINGRPNVIGDGINVAQRVMSFAEPNQILVSRSYYEIVSRLTNDMLKMFTYSGIKHDKHVREHEVYVIRTSGDVAPTAAQPSPEPAVASPPVQAAISPKMAIAIGLALLGAIAVAAAVFVGKKDAPSEPTQPLPAVSIPPQSAAPQPKTKPELPAPEVKAEASTPKNKQKPKAAVSKSVESAAQAEAKPQGDHKPAESSASASHNPPPAEQNANQEKKSGWERFSDSVKQGAEKPKCTDAMRMLKQCN